MKSMQKFVAALLGTALCAVLLATAASKQIIADTIEAVGYGTTDPASAASDMYNQLSNYISAQ